MLGPAAGTDRQIADLHGQLASGGGFPRQNVNECLERSNGAAVQGNFGGSLRARESIRRVQRHHYIRSSGSSSRAKQRDGRSGPNLQSGRSSSAG